MPATKKSPDEILGTEWSSEFQKKFTKALGEVFVRKNANQVARFIDLCQKAMILSFHKYGAVADGYGPTRELSAVGSIPARVERYTSGGWRGDVEIEPGNIEWLTDVYNFAMIEFMCPHEPISDEVTSLKAVIPDDQRPRRILFAVDHFQKSEIPKPVNLLIWIAEEAYEEFVNPQVREAYFRGTDAQSPGRFMLEEDGEHFLSEGANEGKYKPVEPKF